MTVDTYHGLTIAQRKAIIAYRNKRENLFLKYKGKNEPRKERL